VRSARRPAPLEIAARVHTPAILSTARRQAERTGKCWFERAIAVDPRRSRHLDPFDRTRHVGGDGNFRQVVVMDYASKSPKARRGYPRRPKVIAAYLGADEEEAIAVMESGT